MLSYTKTFDHVQTTTIIRKRCLRLHQLALTPQIIYFEPFPPCYFWTCRDTGAQAVNSGPREILGPQLSGGSVLFVCQFLASGDTGAPAVGAVCPFRVSILGLGGYWGILGATGARAVGGVFPLRLSILGLGGYWGILGATGCPAVRGVCPFRLSIPGLGG